jgi:hypothetical protein
MTAPARASAIAAPTSMGRSAPVDAKLLDAAVPTLLVEASGSEELSVDEPLLLTVAEPPATTGTTVVDVVVQSAIAGPAVPRTTTAATTRAVMNGAMVNRFEMLTPDPSLSVVPAPKDPSRL